MKLKPLSELELEVMEIVWDLGECTVRDVVEQINKQKQFAYTTIATVLSRLVDKGSVKKVGEGLEITYVPRLSKEDMGKTVAQSFVQKFFNSFGDVALASFAQSIDNLPKKKKEYLLELLNDYDKTK